MKLLYMEVFFTFLCLIHIINGTILSKNEIEYEELNDEITKKIQRQSLNFNSPPEIRLSPSGLILTKNYLNYANRIRNMDVRPDDVWLISYPKAGTTMCMEMVWLLKNNLDFEYAKKNNLFDVRVSFLDYKYLNPESANDIPDTVQVTETMASPRVIKTHLLPELLPRKLFEVNPKIIYVTRGPKDTVVSYYHHLQLWGDYQGPINDIFDGFLQDKLIYSPYWKHLFTYWKLRKNKDNILIFTYEDMMKDLRKVIMDTSQFLKVEYSEDQIGRLMNHLSFDSMRNNSMVNFEVDRRSMEKLNLHHIRRGKVGGWQDEMPAEISAKFDEWAKGNFAESDTDFPYYRPVEK